MKKVLTALVAIVLLVVVAAVIAMLVTPTSFAVERDIVINKPKSEVFTYLKSVKKQNDWTPWQKKDPNTKHSYEGNDGEVGFIAKWESDHEEVGTGEQEIIKIEEGKRIDSKLRFKAPFESEADAFLATEDAGANQTKVTWGFSGNMPRPWNLMTLFIDMEGAVAKDFDEGLGSLKEILEKQESPKEESEGDGEDSEEKDEDKEDTA